LKLRKEGGKKMMAIEKDTFGERLRKLRVFGKLKGSSVFASENGKILSTSWWSKRIARYSRLAGVKITPYSLRHTFAIEFLRNGGDLFSLQRILGHLDLTTTKRYIHLSQDDIREIHSKASPVQKLQEIDRRAPRSIKET